MVLFLFMAFNLGLLALAAGAFVLVWSLRNSDVGSNIARAVGVIISVLALISLVYLGSDLMRAMTGGHNIQRPAGMPVPPPQPSMQGHVQQTITKPAQPAQKGQ
ncbi:MAG TPA: hypothetical protein VLG38_04620 [Gammaproteobacteria bacterium]|nr:hypothetical protein [Gammaproteobacteria bacterium]